MTTVQLFKSISRLWNCFLLSATTDGRDGLEMKLVKTWTVFFLFVCFVLFLFSFYCLFFESFNDSAYVRKSPKKILLVSATFMISPSYLY